MNRFENMGTFIRVVEVGSISGAADRLGVAKSAVSRRLKELEAHLGAELFHRTTRSMNLTDSGRAFYHQSVRILDDVLEAELATSQAHGTLKGSLKIALPSTFGLMHMGPAINEFSKAHPQIEFDLDFNDREVDLMQEGFDLARVPASVSGLGLARALLPHRGSRLRIEQLGPLVITRLELAPPAVRIAVVTAPEEGRSNDVL